MSEATVTITVTRPGGVRIGHKLKLGPGRHEIPAQAFDDAGGLAGMKALCMQGYVSVRDPRRAEAVKAEEKAPAKGEKAAKQSPKGEGKPDEKAPAKGDGDAPKGE